MTRTRSLFRLAAAVATVMCVAPAAARPDAVPYKPLRPGTVLDYGSWKCTVAKIAGLDTVCADGGNQVRIFGHFVPYGPIGRGGYGGLVPELECYEQGLNNRSEVVSFGAYTLNDAARREIRRFWPLHSGSRASFELRTGRGVNDRVKVTLRVDGTETVRAGGAQRKTLRVKEDGVFLACLDNPGPVMARQFYRRTWWYDPGAGAVVKSEFRWTDAVWSGLGKGYTLAKLVPPAGAAAKPRTASRTAPPKPASPKPVASRSAPKRKAVVTPKHKPVAAVADQDTTAPVIDIPPTISTESGVVVLTGRVLDRSRVVELSIDGRAGRLGPDGVFRIRRGVARGRSRLTISALDEWGNRAEKIIEVNRAAPVRPSRATSATKSGPKAAVLFPGIDFGRYHALVIGNNKYRTLPNLDTAVNDARAVAEVLKTEYGFDTTLLIDTTRKGLIDALARYRARLKGGDNLLVYYAGHGVLDDVTRQGYWLPVDAEQGSPSNWVSVNDITLMIKAIRARHVLVVADSCYSGTLVRAVPGRLKTASDRLAWVKRMRAKRARTALTSGGLEPVLDSDGGEHSVFAKSFITSLKENRGVLEGQRLFDTIKRPVVLNSDQTPNYSDIRRAGHEGGDFLFVRR